MTRPITLFTGQWADLPLAELAPLAKSMGYDGLELACWGDHFDIQAALASDSYVRDKRALVDVVDCLLRDLKIAEGRLEPSVIAALRNASQTRGGALA